MERRLAIRTALAAVLGLAVGAALFVDPATLDEATPELGGGEAPRLAMGGVAIDVTNEGARRVEVEVDVRNAQDQRMFQSLFNVEPGATVRRNIVSLPAGAYLVRMTADLTVVQEEPFHTDDCAGRIHVAFRVARDAGAVAPRGSFSECG